MRSEIKENVWKLKVFIHDKFRQHGIKPLADLFERNPKTLGNQANEYCDSHNLKDVDLYLFTALTNDYSIIDEYERMLNRVAISLHRFGRSRTRVDLLGSLSKSMSSMGTLAQSISDTQIGEFSMSDKELDNISRQTHQHIREVLSILDVIKRDNGKN